MVTSFFFVFLLLFFFVFGGPPGSVVLRKRALSGRESDLSPDNQVLAIQQRARDPYPWRDCSSRDVRAGREKALTYGHCWYGQGKALRLPGRFANPDGYVIRYLSQCSPS